MAVWNVPDAGEVIKEILDEDTDQTAHQKKNLTVAEKIRKKAAAMRKNERLGMSGFDPISEVQSNEGQREMDDTANQQSMRQENAVRGQKRKSDKVLEEKEQKKKPNSSSHLVVFDSK